MNIKQIIKEEVNSFDWVNEVPTGVYRPCSHFQGEANELCTKLSGLRAWLHKDLGLRGVVDETLKGLKTVKDLTDKYQEPLRVLHNTGKYKQITLTNGVYSHQRLLNAGLVLDGAGDYHYVNKLNTNYSDLAEMLTELLIRGGKVTELNNKNVLGVKQYLYGIKGSLLRLMTKYFEPTELKEFIRNSVNMTIIGDKAEGYVGGVLTKYGMLQIYQGGDGDFIDMLFGIDLIMDYNGRTITCQVKSRETALAGAMNNPYYSKIDYFIAPIDGIGSGIVIHNKNGRSFKISDDGRMLR